MCTRTQMCQRDDLYNDEWIFSRAVSGARDASQAANTPGHMADSWLKVSYRNVVAAVKATITVTHAHHMDLNPISSESCTAPLYFFDHGLESLLSLFLKDITIPVFLWCQVHHTFRMGKKRGRLHGLIAIPLAETELGPKCADSMKYRRGTFGYRVRSS